MSSPYIYINAPLPRRFEPPVIGGRETLSAASLGELLRLNDAEIAAQADGTREERILSVFTHPEVLFGDPSFIPANRPAWLERIGAFTARNEPIPFVTMAFAYKMQNPLKTDRRAPDLGEALMLRRFEVVLRAIGAVYPPGARLTILEEGILGRCLGVDPRVTADYRAGIDQIVAVSGIDRGLIDFHSLDDMVTAIPNFEARWIHEQERLRELWQQGDPAIRTAYAGTVPATRTSVPSWDYDPVVLAAAYDPVQIDSALRYPRDYIDKVAHRQFFAYRAILALRDSTGYLAALRPHALKMTVSPKPENLAVTPINLWSRILPYHGLPVLDADGRWHITYRGALGAEYGELQALHLQSDADPTPIAYRAVARAAR